MIKYVDFTYLLPILRYIVSHIQHQSISKWFNSVKNISYSRTRDRETNVQYVLHAEEKSLYDKLPKGGRERNILLETGQSRRVRKRKQTLLRIARINLENTSPN